MPNHSLIQVSCDMCNNGSPTSNMYIGSVCPEGTIPSGTGDPCETINVTIGMPCFELVMNSSCQANFDAWASQGSNVYSSTDLYYPGQVVSFFDITTGTTNYFIASAASGAVLGSSSSNPQLYPEPISVIEIWEGCEVAPCIAAPSNLTNTPTGVVFASINTIVSDGCSVSGPGIPLGTTVVSVQTHYNPMYLEIVLSQTPDFNYYEPTQDAPSTPGVHNNGFNTVSGLTDLTLGFSTNLLFTCSQHEDTSVLNTYSTYAKTLSFKEDIKGWVSFKSFTPENAISMANDYYTFLNGSLYQHHIETVNRNNFYGDPYDSSITVLLNDNPSYIKEFTTLNYEGSQSKVEKFVSELRHQNDPFQPTTTYNDQEYYNLYEKDGWHVDSIITNDEDGHIDEFLEKEGKWFNYIKRKVDLSLDEADTSDFSFQGIGFASHIDCPDCPQVTSWNCGVEPPTPPTPPQEAYNECGNLPNLGDLDGFMTVAFASGNQNTLFQNIGTWTMHFRYNSAASIQAGSSLGNPIGMANQEASDPYGNSSVFTYCPDNNWDGPMMLGITTPGVGKILRFGGTGGNNVNTAVSASELIADLITMNWNVSQGDSWADILAESENQTSTWDQAVYPVRHPLVGHAPSYDTCKCSDAIPGNPGSPGGATTCLEVYGAEGDYQTEEECLRNCIDDSLPSLWICADSVGNCTEVFPNDPTYANHVIGSSAWLSQEQCNTVCQVYGCTDSTALNYYAGATVDDGSCCYIAGCMNPEALNYNPEACEPAICYFPDGDISGCTDSNATNYNPLATIDDSSCLYDGEVTIYGCTDPLASNYNPLATLNDDADPCEYETVPATCGNIFISGALESCDDFLCLLSPNPGCSAQTFPNAMALATYWADEITSAANGNPTNNTPQGGYVDQNGVTIGAITAQEMYDLLESCCVTLVEE